MGYTIILKLGHVIVEKITLGLIILIEMKILYD